MKISLLLFTTALSLALSTDAHAKTIQVTVDGMVCSFCAQGIEKKMKAQAGTDKVFVSLEKQTTLVALKAGQDITDAVIKAEITDAGYVVKAISRSDESFDVLRDKIKAAK
jgi:copper chaperone CopZ